MEQLLQNPIFVAKMKSLSPATRRWFIDALIDLFDQESEYVIDVIEDCREEMKETADRYRDEADQLRTASRLLHEKRTGPSPSTSPTRSISRISAPSRLLYVNERMGTQDSIRLRHRRRRIAMSDDDGRVSSLSVPSMPTVEDDRTPRLPPPSARTTRSLPVSPCPKPMSLSGDMVQAREARRIREESQAIIKTMTVKENQVEQERERQQERLERIRRQKKFLAQDRTQQALKLLEKALEMDKVLAQDKERQGLQLRSRMDEMRKKKEQKKDAEFVEIIELQETK